MRIFSKMQGLLKELQNKKKPQKEDIKYVNINQWTTQDLKEELMLTDVLFMSSPSRALADRIEEIINELEARQENQSSLVTIWKAIN